LAPCALWWWGHSSATLRISELVGAAYSGQFCGCRHSTLLPARNWTKQSAKDKPLCCLYLWPRISYGMWCSGLSRTPHFALQTMLSNFSHSWSIMSWIWFCWTPGTHYWGRWSFFCFPCCLLAILWRFRNQNRSTCRFRIVYGKIQCHIVLHSASFCSSNLKIWFCSLGLAWNLSFCDRLFSCTAGKLYTIHFKKHSFSYTPASYPTAMFCQTRTKSLDHIFLLCFSRLIRWSYGLCKIICACKSHWS